MPAAPFAAGAAHAVEPKAARPATPAQLAQRERMKGCAAQARGQSLSGQPRKVFMKGCLSGG
ncbi:PsiF family protein [Pseudoroseomonas globiformis]|uniref:PsiF family protein n=1 Tax=Teichococcus globiformis TaxID=2307229 RepID=A0ABV7G353_9PROT